MRQVATLDAFRRDTEAFLAADEVANDLLISLVRYLGGAHAEVGAPHFFVVEDGGRVAGIAMRTGEKRAIIYSLMPDAAVPLLATITIPGLDMITGPRPLVEGVLKRQGRGYDVVMGLGHYACERTVPPPKPAAGRLRVATEADLDVVTAWQDAFVAEALPHEKRGDEREKNRQRILGGHQYLWEVDGRPVCKTHLVPATATMMRLTGVYTPKSERGKGYASHVVEGATRAALAAGIKHVTLFTDLLNPTSNAIYQSVGYRRVGERFSVRIRT